MSILIVIIGIFVMQETNLPDKIINPELGELVYSSLESNIAKYPHGYAEYEFIDDLPDHHTDLFLVKIWWKNDQVARHVIENYVSHKDDKKNYTNEFYILNKDQKSHLHRVLKFYRIHGSDPYRWTLMERYTKLDPENYWKVIRFDINWKDQWIPNSRRIKHCDKLKFTTDTKKNEIVSIFSINEGAFTKSSASIDQNNLPLLNESFDNSNTMQIKCQNKWEKYKEGYYLKEYHFQMGISSLKCKCNHFSDEEVDDRIFQLEFLQVPDGMVIQDDSELGKEQRKKFYTTDKSEKKDDINYLRKLIKDTRQKREQKNKD